MPVDPSNLDAVIAAAKKKFNGDVIRLGGNTPSIKRISFGSIEYDLATWGGAPMGRVVRPWGGKHTAKSLLTWGLVRNAQNYRDDEFPDGLTVAYFNAEGQYDEDFTRDKMGVDVDKLILVEGSIIEEMTLKAQALLEVAHILIIDSIGNCISRLEYETSPDKHAPRGTRARAWGRFVTDVVERMDKFQNMIVAIDQIRVNQSYGNEESSGSAIWDHNSSMDLHHRKTKNLYRDAKGELTDQRPQKSNYDTLGGEVVIDGFEIGMEVNKSRVCRPFGKARMRLDLDTMQWDKPFELKKVALYLGVISQSGAYFYVDGEKKAIHGEAALKQRLTEDTALIMNIYGAAEKHLAAHGYGRRAAA